jgi:dihydrofolate reductase
MITLIAAIGRNYELGFKNQLLWKIPEDMKHFKSYTMGKVVVMGSNTFVSIGRPLPGRKNVVVSHQQMMGVVVAKDIESALSIEHCYNEIVVIGGASVYKQTIDLADKLVITHVDSNFEADVFFPTIDLTKWKINSTLEGSNETYKYRFVDYVRNESSGNYKRETGDVCLDFRSNLQ